MHYAAEMAQNVYMTNGVVSAEMLLKQLGHSAQ